MYMEHDMRCKFANPLLRHNMVQRALRTELAAAALDVERATVHELRAGDSDPSQKQADLLVRGLFSWAVF